MLRKLTIIIIAVFISNISIGQDCPIINSNGSFEEMIFVPGGEATIGITTGQIANWKASHGTVDYVTPDWNWYDIEGITSVAGHMCYGNRETHDHSEGMYTEAKIYGDNDLLYTLSLDYGTICESSQNGFLNIALNNNLSSEGGHSWFQYPTPEAFPEFFQEIQPLDRMELVPAANIQTSGVSKYEISFVPNSDYEQIWLFTEYQHEQEDFINCGLVIDNVKLTATTSALTGIAITDMATNNFNLTPKFSKDLNVVSYNWMVNDQPVGNNNNLTQVFTEGVYTICLDIIDDRGACGSTCREFSPASTDEENNLAACVYSSCLDLGGLPNVVSLEFLAASGAEVRIDQNTEGFYFPYCIGTASMCAGGANEVDLLVEDLNAYFRLNDMNSKATLGYSSLASDIECRSLAITITSSDLTPKKIELVDNLTDQVSLFSIDFDFDPDNCGSSLIENEVEFYAFNGDETDHEQGGEFIQKMKPTVKGRQLSLNAELSEELLSEVGIYTTGGNKIKTINNFVQGDEINLDNLPSGMYVINLINEEAQKSGFFYVGE